MTWQDEAIPTLRILINDLSSTPDYSDERLEQTLVVAAKLIQQECVFANTYSVSIENVSISPDPQDEGDEAFMNMLILKAACVVDHSTFRTKAALEGVKAAMGPANLQVIGHLAGFRTILEVGTCATYSDLKDQLLWGNIDVVKAVMSPFSSNRADFRYLSDYYNCSTNRAYRT